MAAQGWRLAFSRPGFVTGKHDTATSLPSGIFIRTASHSIGQARGGRSSELIAEMRKQLEQSSLANKPFDQLHVWPKDRLPIGRFGFEPGVDEVAQAVADEIFRCLGEEWLSCDAPNRIAQPGDSVLDVVLIEPAHWFIGTHTAETWPTRWPGAVQPMDLTEPPVSRAYYKAAEAVQWSGFPLQPGDLAVEIGSAPGGACGRLLELGLRVLGVDPADMDPQIAEHPRLQHIRARAGDLPRKEFRGAKWMLLDSNVKPDQALVTVENIVTNRQSEFEGLLLTLKLVDYEQTDAIERWLSKIRSWGVKDVRARQLARNKCEICLAVSM